MRHFVFGILGLAAALPAFAGPSISGGGKGVLCTKNGTQSVELLDLWEARTIYGRNPRAADGSVDQMVAKNLRALATALSGVSVIPVGEKYKGDGVYNLLMETANEFLRPSGKVRRLRGTTLRDTEDSDEVATPTDCQLVQVVNYRISTSISDIYINQDLLEMMDPVNQAALISHEAVYAYLRLFHREENSVRVRRAVGMAFAGHQFKDFDEVAPKKRIFCHGFMTDSVSFFQEGKETKAVPVVVNGQATLGYSALQAMPLEPLSPDSWQNFFFEDGSCAGQPDSETMQDSKPLFLVNDPDSVDYDATVGYLRTCLGGRVRLVVTPKGYNGSENISVKDMTPLSCDWWKE